MIAGRVGARGLRVFLAVGAYAFFLMVLAPATILDAGIARASAGKLRIAQSQGTLWAGTGLLEIRDSTGKRGIGRPLSWRFKPGSLLRAQVGFEVDIGQTRKYFLLVVSLARLEIFDADLVLPAAALALATPRLALLDPGGDLHIHVSRLSIGRDAVHGAAVVRWPDAVSSLTPVSPLGDYELRLEESGDGTNVVLGTLKGPLHLEGRGSTGTSNAAAFQATARIDPHYRVQLEPLLRMIAVERGEGIFEIQFNHGGKSSSDIGSVTIAR